MRTPERRKTPRARMGVLAAAVLALVSGGCTQVDDAWAAIPFLSMLRDAPSYDPYEMTRPAPPHSVPFEAPMGEVLPPIVPTDAGLRAFAAEHANPVAVDSASLARGQAMYERYCLVCHGPEGMGRQTGPVTATGAYPAIAPPVASGTAVALSDGYIYGITRVGRGLMPPYGDRITHTDRWHIVNYIRSLQGAGGAPQGQSAATATADSAQGR